MVHGVETQAERATGTIKFPEFEGEYRKTSQAAMDDALNELSAHKDEWVSLEIKERIQILDEMMEAMEEASEEWVAVSLEMKNEKRGSFGEGEEWASIWPIFRLLRILRQSLEDIRVSGRPRIPGPIRQRSDGQVVAQVFPQSSLESLIYLGTKAEVWMQPEVTERDLIAEQALPYRNPPSAGKVALVLGAGNIPYLPLGQSLYKLLVPLQVVILKLNPVNAYIGPIMEKVLRPLIDRGYMRMVYGGVSEGSYLADHPLVDEIHLTGSDKTFEAIVFGVGKERDERKARRDPRLTKRIEAELGNVSPVIVVPGPWSESDLKYQATQLATWLIFNSGYYCLTPRVLIQHKGWIHRQNLIAKLGDVFSSVETRKAWYPGSAGIHESFMAEHPEALRFGRAKEGNLPWTLIADVDSTREDEIAFTTEGFCSLMAETALEADSVAEYLERAVAFANDRLWGTLSATILVHPKSLRDPEIAAAFERAIADLHYGTVYVNDFTGFGICWVVTPWGSYPNDDIYDVQSGIGVICNALMFERTQKAVIRAPFKKFPNPFLVTKKRMAAFTRRLAYFDAKPGVGKLLGVFWSALTA
ncbi:MAG: aldehyde dehydrogenase family protein [Anaerolineales bacterium]